MPGKEHKTLSQVVGYIRRLVEEKLADKRFWLKVEISNINFHHTGHCYLDLIENHDGKTIATCKAAIWSYNLVHIHSQLGTDLGNILKKGAEILCLAEVTFTEVHGLGINIQDVDKYFAFGNLERKKQETVTRLTQEKLIGRNKVYALPTVIQKIAVIGAINTSGHEDLVKQLEQNEYGYRFALTYFNCLVQGEKAEHEIIQRLNAVQNSTFDVVALIRGGGSKLDLEVFNSYAICEVIANHTKPILTGIGHETDACAVDMVANQSFKTPSALGSFIVDRNYNFFVKLQNSYREIRKIYDLFIQRENHRIKQGLLQYKTSSISYTQLRRGNLHQIGNRISVLVRKELANANHFVVSSKQIICVSIPNSLQNRRNRLKEISDLCQLRTQQSVRNKSNALSHQMDLIRLHVGSRLKNERDFLSQAVEIMQLVHPDNVLERGYSITRRNGSFLNREINLRAGDEVEIELFDRRITARVLSVNLKNSKWKTLLTKLQQKN